MRHSIALKFLAIMLCALSIVSVTACGFGILFMENWNLYNTSLDELKAQKSESIATDIAVHYAQLQATQSLSNCPQEIIDDVLMSYNLINNYVRSDYAVEIYEKDTLVFGLNNTDGFVAEHTYTYPLVPNYPIVTYQYTYQEYTGSAAASDIGIEFAAEPTVYPTYPPEESEQAATEPVLVDMIPSETAPDPTEAELARAREMALDLVEGQEVLFSTEHSEQYWNGEGIPYTVTYVLDYYAGPEYLVKVSLSKNAVLGTEYALMSVLYPYRGYFIPVLLGSLLVFAATLVYLFAAAGCAKGGEIAPAGLNKIPLDIYAAGAGIGIFALLCLLVELLDNFGSGYYGIWDNIPVCTLIVGGSLFLIALLAVGFLFALAAQIKAKDGYWWRHSICGWCLQQIVLFLRWVRRGLRYFYRGCRAVVRLLPIVWQWLLTAFLMVLIPLLAFLLLIEARGFGEFYWSMVLLLSIGADIGLVCYGAWCFGTLFKAVRSLTQGNLNHQIDTRYFFGCFKDFAVHLNEVAGAAQLAAQQQMKSERMKTELITNVSHDIKTPLTSIINYVDLLQKPHSEEEGVVYLEVLERQSLRLKKLVDDLMDMSKASSGNMSVQLEQIDAAEAINQALGEFADKLEQANLTPVFRHPDSAVLIQADGKLVWRVLSNLLNNAVKYAMSGTRLYIDLTTLRGSAIIAIKNISQSELNIDADELMERFVRGDTSRNTEGSGLGLNIAKSLVELQQGQMHLMVDGDLFKVTLIFPLD